MSDRHSYLSLDQVLYLTRGLNPERVKMRDGMSHLEAYDVRRELTRIFGFGRWSSDVVDTVQLFERVWEDEKRGERVSVGYRCTLRLSVHAPDGTLLATYTEVACGDATNFPLNKRADAHDFAVKTAESQALKRCAINLGDQLGLSLYANSSRKPVVQWTLGPLGDAVEAVYAQERGEQPATSTASEVRKPDTSGEQVPDEVDPTVAAPQEEREETRERSAPRKPNGKRAPQEPPAEPAAVTVDPPEHPRQPPAEQSPAERAAAKWAEAIGARKLGTRERQQTILRLRAETITEHLAEERVGDGVTLKAALTREFAEAKAEGER